MVFAATVMALQNKRPFFNSFWKKKYIVNVITYRYCLKLCEHQKNKGKEKSRMSSMKAIFNNIHVHKTIQSL